MARFAYAHLCDDIRREINGKYSLMGIWGPLHFLPRYPFSLPLVAISAFLRTELSENPDQVTLVLSGPGESRIELETDMRDLPDATPTDHPFRVLIVHAMIPDLAIPEPGRMDVYMEVGGERLLAQSVLFSADEPI